MHWFIYSHTHDMSDKGAELQGDRETGSGSPCLWCGALIGVSNPWPIGHMRPGTAMNVAQHKIVNLLKTL